VPAVPRAVLRLAPAAADAEPDLLVLLSLSVSLAFFNHADIDASVPLVYPPLLYLLARMLWLARRGAPRPPPLRLNVRARGWRSAWSFLVAFRIGSTSSTRT
jgi:hypothetical protein